jgi:hypothetical protein
MHGDITFKIGDLAASFIIDPENEEKWLIVGKLINDEKGWKVYDVPTGYGDTSILKQRKGSFRTMILDKNGVEFTEGCWLKVDGKEPQFVKGKNIVMDLSELGNNEYIINGMEIITDPSEILALEMEQ